jgi:hypothetical protein
MEGKQKVVWAEFSTLGQAVFVLSAIASGWHIPYFINYSVHFLHGK